MVPEKGGIGPVAGSLYHIMVIHQHDRGSRTVSFPPQEKASVEVFMLAAGKNIRKLFPQQFLKFIKFLFICLIFRGNRFLPDQRCKTLSVQFCAFIGHIASSFLCFRNILLLY